MFTALAYDLFMMLRIGVGKKDNGVHEDIARGL